MLLASSHITPKMRHNYPITRACYLIVTLQDKESTILNVKNTIILIKINNYKIILVTLCHALFCTHLQSFLHH